MRHSSSAWTRQAFVFVEMRFCFTDDGRSAVPSSPYSDHMPRLTVDAFQPFWRQLAGRERGSMLGVPSQEHRCHRLRSIRSMRSWVGMSLRRCSTWPSVLDGTSLVWVLLQMPTRHPEPILSGLGATRVSRKVLTVIEADRALLNDLHAVRVGDRVPIMLYTMELNLIVFLALHRLLDGA